MLKKLCVVGLAAAWPGLLLTAYLHWFVEQPACADWLLCQGQRLFAEGFDLGAIAAQAHPQQDDGLLKVLAELGHRLLLGVQLLLAVALFALAWRPAPNLVATVGRTTLLLVVVGLQLAHHAGWMAGLASPLAATGQPLLGMAAIWLLFGLCLADTDRAASPVARPLATVNGIAMVAVFVHIVQALAVSGRHHLQDWPPTRLWLGDFSIVVTGQALVQAAYLASAAISFMVLAILAVLAVAKPNPVPVRVAAISAWLLGVGLLATELAAHWQGLPAPLLVAHALGGALLMLPLLAIAAYRRRAAPAAHAQPAAPAPEPAAAPAVDKAPAPGESYLRLRSQLWRTRGGLGSLLARVALGQKPMDEAVLEELETQLLLADVGIAVSRQIIDELAQSLERQHQDGAQTPIALLRQALLAILQPCAQPLRIQKQDHPFVILVVGVNGVGKTTTIGKLAHKLQAQGHGVMLAAGDTFRAAAVEQLQTWGERNQIPVVAQHTGADSASVIFDAVQSAHAKGVDVLLADTAGRLHTKSNLMDELKKVKRIIGKLDPGAPHEVLLVLDAGTGQNAVAQARQFSEAVGVTGLVLTKLDGTAKGGVIFALARQLAIPVRFIGVGEGIDDLQPFDAEAFVDALLAKD